jgi:hypothetical protein
MADEITPALTASEWLDAEVEARYGTHTTSLHVDHKGRVFAHSQGNGEEHRVILNEWRDAPRVLPALMALANHGLPDDHPNKITREDVALARLPIAPHMAHAAEPARTDASWAYWNTQRRWRELAAKLSALLPPEDAR